ncbi:dihydrolipoamide acetyltransferase family protein [Jatrophihabitans sp. YIM 134969]
MTAVRTAAEFRLPDVGEGLEEAEIVTWHVRTGDSVTVNQVIVEIETAKSLVELPSPFTGVVLDLLVAEGATVAVGTPIIRIGEPGGLPAPEVPASSTGTVSDERTAILVGAGPRTGSGPRRGRVSARRYGRGEAERPRPAAPTSSPPPASSRPRATPPVRKLARDLGVDLAGLAGSGPGGSITRADVSAAVGAGLRNDGGPATVRAVEPSQGARETRVPIRGVRRSTAAAMVESAFTAPHVTEFVTVDVTATMNLLERLRARREYRGLRLSPMTLLARAMCLAARRTPEINSSWDAEHDEIVFRHHVGLGIASATDRGLLVPVVPDADRLDLPALAAAIAEVVDAARSAAVTPAQLAGGTMTITNIGVFGIDTGTPILPPGQSAIVCLGAVSERPWVVDHALAVRQVTTLGLSFDHRLVDGAQGSQFLADVAALLHDPGQALAWV